MIQQTTCPRHLDLRSACRRTKLQLGNVYPFSERTRNHCKQLRDNNQIFRQLLIDDPFLNYEINEIP